MRNTLSLCLIIDPIMESERKCPKGVLSIKTEESYLQLLGMKWKKKCSRKNLART
jgi:hypothetical protein